MELPRDAGPARHARCCIIMINPSWPKRMDSDAPPPVPGASNSTKRSRRCAPPGSSPPGRMRFCREPLELAVLQAQNLGGSEYSLFSGHLRGSHPQRLRNRQPPGMRLPPSCAASVNPAHAVRNIRRRSAHRQSSLRPPGRKTDGTSYGLVASRMVTEISRRPPRTWAARPWSPWGTLFPSAGAFTGAMDIFSP